MISIEYTKVADFAEIDLIEGSYPDYIYSDIKKTTFGKNILETTGAYCLTYRDECGIIAIVGWFSVEGSNEGELFSYLSKSLKSQSLRKVKDFARTYITYDENKNPIYPVIWVLDGSVNAERFAKFLGFNRTDCVEMDGQPIRKWTLNGRE
jgi:hypothetical protein